MFWTILLGLSLLSYEGGVARVKRVYGDAMVLPYGAEDWEYLFKNDVIGEGDIIKTLDGSRISFAFGKGNVVSLAENTEVEVNALDDNFNFRLTNGIMRVMSRNSEGRVEIMNQDVHIYSYSTVRFQRHGAMAKVSVVRGEAEVDDEIVRAGEMARIYPDGKVVIRREFHHDDFDRWASEYERKYIVIREVEYVPSDVYIGVCDLESYGHWRYVAGYGWVWVPDVGPDWRPYYYGHWVFRVRYGWVWVSYEEWGWVPYHYGRWAWVSGIGWVWVPGDEWRGAWVVWYEGPSWVSWAPIDPYGRPIVYVTYHGRKRYVAPVVDYSSFRKPVYRYKPPVNGVYKKPVYRTRNVHLTKDIVKKYEKPVIGIVPPHIKPVYKKKWERQVERIINNPQIVKKPIENRRPVYSEPEKRTRSGVVGSEIEKKPHADRKPVRVRKGEGSTERKPIENRTHGRVNRKLPIERTKKDTVIKSVRERRHKKERGKKRVHEKRAKESRVRDDKEGERNRGSVDLPRHRVNNSVISR